MLIVLYLRTRRQPRSTRTDTLLPDSTLFRYKPRQQPLRNRGVRRSHKWVTLNHMVHHHARLDTTFAALSDATRRVVLEQLGNGEASISDLARRFHMTLDRKSTRLTSSH